MMLYFLLIAILFAEILSFRAILFLTQSLSPNWQSIIMGCYILWTVLVLGCSVYGFINRESLNESVFNYTKYFILSLFVINLFFKMVLGAFHGLNEGATLAINTVTKGKMTRSTFISLTGLVLASVPFSTMLLGMAWGRARFKLTKQRLSFPHLPKAFHNQVIVHISDLHLGSFPKGSKDIEEAVARINEIDPDYIFFTGDMINERAQEAERFIEPLKQLKAKKGKYSVLGNHDYGNYYGPWATDIKKQKQNVEHLASIQEKMGFVLLRNQNVSLTSNNESIRLIGLENWGKGFSQHGDLQKALEGVADNDFQILLSHDPSHWDEQVLGKTAIDLSLAGHTHGCQYGVELPGFKWSPVQYRYPRWAGLYKEGKQMLYINRGLGTIGYAGRFGILPEITVFELASS